ncbi:MAG: cytidine deaminase [Vicinamibacterales bacterium]
MAGSDPLLDAARTARTRAMARYSGFAVGAALESTDDGIFTGCNIENASYGLTICAERVALFSALCAGHRAFRRIVVLTDTAVPTPPCGPCRQVIWEFAGDIEVVLANLDGVQATYRMTELLPHPFDDRNLGS